eukprot:TRINITY_DN4367_c0_g1_i1.p1 TRINITY_DN4367_c0_g1~~TRINITY_DN4367_c0_g1_i1.p1  ORF type:complete len:1085 (+),score=376.77 TRINITY_DN4367_c0_g1_i1:53-3307(+)
MSNDDDSRTRRGRAGSPAVPVQLTGSQKDKPIVGFATSISAPQAQTSLEKAEKKKEKVKDPKDKSKTSLKALQEKSKLGKSSKGEEEGGLLTSSSSTLIQVQLTEEELQRSDVTLVTLQVLCPTISGQTLAVCGSVKQLGEWDQSASKKLTYIKGATIKDFNWKLGISLPSDLYFEYKYLLLDDAGNMLRWEQRSNREVQLMGTKGYRLMDEWQVEHIDQELTQLEEAKRARFEQELQKLEEEAQESINRRHEIIRAREEALELALPKSSDEEAKAKALEAIIEEERLEKQRKMEEEARKREQDRKKALDEMKAKEDERKRELDAELQKIEEERARVRDERKKRIEEAKRRREEEEEKKKQDEADYEKRRAARYARRGDSIEQPKVAAPAAAAPTPSPLAVEAVEAEEDDFEKKRAEMRRVRDLKLQRELEEQKKLEEARLLREDERKKRLAERRANRVDAAQAEEKQRQEREEAQKREEEEKQARKKEREAKTEEFRKDLQAHAVANAAVAQKYGVTRVQKEVPFPNSVRFPLNLLRDPEEKQRQEREEAQKREEEEKQARKKEREAKTEEFRKDLQAHAVANAAVAQKYGVTRVQKEVPFPNSVRFPLNLLRDPEGNLSHEYIRDHFLKEGRLELDCAAQIIKDATALLKSEPNLLALAAPIVVCGDLHGQYYDLVTKLMDLAGTPDYQPYLFLGDYVDRGHFSTEIIFYLLTLKLQFPQRIFLLRGNHECRSVSAHYNFKTECLYKYDSSIYELFMDAFDALPVAATVETPHGKYLCLHAGLGPSIKTLEDIDKLDRFQEIPERGPLCDLVWADPVDESIPLTEKELGDWYLVNFKSNPTRGCSYIFGNAAVSRFLETNGLKAIIRGHEVQKYGYTEHTFKRTDVEGPLVVTIFSAPNYCDKYENLGAFINLTDSECRFNQITWTEHPYVLPQYLDAFTFSLPFIAENVAKVLLNALRWCINTMAETEEDSEALKTVRDKLRAKNKGISKLMILLKLQRAANEDMIRPYASRYEFNLSMFEKAIQEDHNNELRPLMDPRKLFKNKSTPAFVQAEMNTRRPVMSQRQSTFAFSAKSASFAFL